MKHEQSFYHQLLSELGIESKLAVRDFKFRSHSSWSSMSALVTIAFVDEHYGVLISSPQMHEAKTLGDLFDLISKTKKQ